MVTLPVQHIGGSSTQGFGTMHVLFAVLAPESDRRYRWNIATAPPPRSHGASGLAIECEPGRRKPGMLRPGFVGMRGR